MFCFYNLIFEINIKTHYNKYNNKKYYEMYESIDD